MKQGYAYFDTVNENGNALDVYESKAKKQDDIIMDYFKKFAGLSFTPFQVHASIKWGKSIPPITSIRRAMSNLTTKGFLIKLEDKKKEKYGRNNYRWTLRLHSHQLKLFA